MLLKIFGALIFEPSWAITLNDIFAWFIKSFRNCAEEILVLYLLLLLGVSSTNWTTGSNFCILELGMHFIPSFHSGNTTWYQSLPPSYWRRCWHNFYIFVVLCEKSHLSDVRKKQTIILIYGMFYSVKRCFYSFSSSRELSDWTCSLFQQEDTQQWRHTEQQRSFCFFDNYMMYRSFLCRDNNAFG